MKEASLSLLSKISTLYQNAHNNHSCRHPLAVATTTLSILFLSQTHAAFIQKIKRLPSFICDVLILNMTEVWHLEALKRLKNDSEILDIGIGTGGALLRCADMLKEKNISIVGIDYNQLHADTANHAIKHKNMQSNMSVRCMSVYETNELNCKKFDAACFSGSFSLLPDPILVLKHISQHHVKSNGKMHIAQTFQSSVNNLPKSCNTISHKLLYYIKPLIKCVTTIDFGYLIAQNDILVLHEKSGMEILHHDVIKGSVNTKYQAAFLTVLKAP